MIFRLLMISEISQSASYGLKQVIINNFKINSILIVGSQVSSWSTHWEEYSLWWDHHSLSRTSRNGWRTFLTEKVAESSDNTANHWPLAMLAKTSEYLVFWKIISKSTKDKKNLPKNYDCLSNILTFLSSFQLKKVCW